MKVLGISACVWLCICAFALLIMHIKSGKFIKSVFLNALLGIIALAAVNCTHKYTGVLLPINWYTVVGSGVFGIPAVCTFVVMGLLF